jgi:hypothetical protein
VKTALPPAPEILPANIISFPGHLCRKAGGGRKLTVRNPQPTQMKTGGIRIWRLSQVSSPSNDSLHGLCAETRDILTRHHGVVAATARPQGACLLPTDSRAMTLYPLSRARGTEQAESSIHRPMKISNTQAQMTELFARKRGEKTPENFLRDFIEEFHRRTAPSAAKARPSGSARKAAHD